MLEALRDRLKELEGLGRIDGGLPLRSSQFREESGQLPAPDRGDAPEAGRLVCRLTAAKRIHPRAEGENLLILVSPPHEDAASALDGVLRQLPDESTLADSGFAQERHDPAAPSPGLLERAAEPGHLPLAADERRVGGGSREAGHDGRGKRPRW